MSQGRSAEPASEHIATATEPGLVPVHVELLPATAPSRGRELTRRVSQLVSRHPVALVSVTAVAAAAAQLAVRMLDVPGSPAVRAKPSRRLPVSGDSVLISETVVMTRTVVRRRG